MPRQTRILIVRPRGRKERSEAGLAEMGAHLADKHGRMVYLVDDGNERPYFVVGDPSPLRWPNGAEILWRWDPAQCLPSEDGLLEALKGLLLLGATCMGVIAVLAIRM